MDDTYDRPTSDKKDSNSRWARTGYYINVENDIAHNRFKKPTRAERPIKYEKML